jgi:hypothetical protein
MGKINVGRVILGGLAAGLVINIGETVLNLFVLSSEMSEMLKAHNLPDVGGVAIGGFVALCFGLGIVTIWMYAAVRPRYGGGPGTVILTGIAVWLLAFVYPQAGNMLLRMYSPSMFALAVLWGLGEVVLGAFVGAWVYRE